MICQCTLGSSHCFLVLPWISPITTLITFTKIGESVEVCLHRICGASGTLYIQTTFPTTCCPRRTASVKRLRLTRCSLLSFSPSNLKHQSSIYQTLINTLLWNASTIKFKNDFHKKYQAGKIAYLIKNEESRGWMCFLIHFIANFLSSCRVSL